MCVCVMTSLVKAVFIIWEWDNVNISSMCVLLQFLHLCLSVLVCFVSSSAFGSDLGQTVFLYTSYIRKSTLTLVCPFSIQRIPHSQSLTVIPDCVYGLFKPVNKTHSLVDFVMRSITLH